MSLEQTEGQGQKHSNPLFYLFHRNGKLNTEATSASIFCQEYLSTKRCVQTPTEYSVIFLDKNELGYFKEG